MSEDYCLPVCFYMYTQTPKDTHSFLPAVQVKQSIFSDIFD